jgi:6-phosphogluconolactonase (cycloisomerase 2 family)
MSANLIFIICSYVGTRYQPWRRTPLCAGVGAFLLWLLPLVVVLCAPGFGFAQSTLTVEDNLQVDPVPIEAPGPGDNMVFAVRRDARYVVSLSFSNGGEGHAVSYRLGDDGMLTPVPDGTTFAGNEPRAIALARGGDYAVLVNSMDDQLTVMSVGDDGILRPVSQSASGGDNPYDVAVAFGHIVLVANRDSNELSTFHLDRHGQLVGPLATEATGTTPHVVVVGARGHVAVCNQTERSLSLFNVDRRGELVFLSTIALDDMTPRTASWNGDDLFVALDAPSGEDVIRSFTVGRSGEVTQGSDTPCGLFLTDLEANEDGLFAVTIGVDRSGPTPAAKDEVRVYRIDGNNLSLDVSTFLPTLPQPPQPNFKQVSTGPARRPNDRHVIVSEFFGGYLRSLFYDRRR